MNARNLTGGVAGAAQVRRAVSATAAWTGAAKESGHYRSKRFSADSESKGERLYDCGFAYRGFRPASKNAGSFTDAMAQPPTPDYAFYMAHVPRKRPRSKNFIQVAGRPLADRDRLRSRQGRMRLDLL